MGARPLGSHVRTAQAVTTAELIPVPSVGRELLRFDFFAHSDIADLFWLSRSYATEVARQQAAYWCGSQRAFPYLRESGLLPSLCRFQNLATSWVSAV